MQEKFLNNTKYYFCNYYLNGETIEILSLSKEGLQNTIESFKKIYNLK